MPTTQQEADAVENKLAEAMANVDLGNNGGVPTGTGPLAEVKRRLEAAASDREKAAQAFIPKAKQVIEKFVEGKIENLDGERQELSRLVDAKKQELASKVEAMRALQANIVKLAAEIGHLTTHKIVLDMSHFSHGLALGEIVAQGPTPEQQR